MKGDPVKNYATRKCGSILHTNCQVYTLPNFIQVKKGASALRGRWYYQKSHQTNGLVFTHCSSKTPPQRCLDIHRLEKKLNSAVKREYFMQPNLKDISPKLRGSKIFSKLDAARGFHQITLDKKSRLLMTFITPFGRFCFKRLPFGISSAPEIFQRRMTELLGDIEGVQVIIDNILIHGRTMEEHGKRLEETLKLIEESVMKLNPGKCEFRKSTIRYWAHFIRQRDTTQ